MFASLQALLWGTVAGTALLLGSGAAWWLRIPKVWVSAIMAFGAGVLISALTLQLPLAGLSSERPCTSAPIACLLGSRKAPKKTAHLHPGAFSWNFAGCGGAH